MPAIETSIWMALKSRIAGLETLTEMPIAWPLEPFAPPEDNGPYLRVDFIPNRNERGAINSDASATRLGLIQVSYFGKLDEKMARRLEIAGKIVGHFPTDLRLLYGTVSVRVTRTPDVAQGLASDAYVIVPVTIPYETFA